MSNNSGVILKKQLGLDKFKYVQVARILVSNVKIYFVFMDSRHSNTPLTSMMLFRNPMPSMIFTYPFQSKPQIGPAMDIEQFNGMIENSLFLVVDISGRMGDDNLRTKVIENINLKESYSFIYLKSLKELTLPDIKNSVLLQRNKDFLKQRRDNGETGTYLKTIEWNEEDDTILLTFDITPTYEKSVDNYTPELQKYIDNKYIGQIQFLDVSKYIGNKKTYNEFSPSDQGKLVLDLMQNSEVKIWISDPSWWLQGSYEVFSELDASLYDYKGPKKTGKWDSIYGEEIHGTKHLGELLYIIKNLYSDIAKALRLQINESVLKESLKFDLNKTGRKDYDELLNNKDFKTRIVYMSPEDFLYKVDYKRYIINWDNVERIKNSINSNTIFPTPTIIWGSGGDQNKSSWHDGTHRVLALKALGIKEIPVIEIWDKDYLITKKIFKESKLKENGGSYGCVMLNLEHEKDYRIMSLKNDIPIESVYSHKPLNIIDNYAFNDKYEDLGYENKPHVTVFYGLENDSDLFIIKKFVNDNYPQPFILKTLKIDIFEGVEKGECDCLVIKCIPPKELLDINQWIKQMFPHKQTYNEYIPHITLAYIKKGTCREFKDKPLDMEFQVNTKDFIYSGHDKVLMEKTI
jgi:hypothetical protein